MRSFKYANESLDKGVNTKSRNSSEKCWTSSSLSEIAKIPWGKKIESWNKDFVRWGGGSESAPLLLLPPPWNAHTQSSCSKTDFLLDRWWRICGQFLVEQFWPKCRVKQLYCGKAAHSKQFHSGQTSKQLYSCQQVRQFYTGQENN